MPSLYTPTLWGVAQATPQSNPRRPRRRRAEQSRCCEISRRRRWRCPTFKRLPPCHSGPWRARVVPLELQDLKPRRAPWLCRRPSGVGQQCRPARRDFWPRVVAIANPSHPGPACALAGRPPCLLVVFVRLRWARRVPPAIFPGKSRAQEGRPKVPGIATHTPRRAGGSSSSYPSLAAPSNMRFAGKGGRAWRTTSLWDCQTRI